MRNKLICGLFISSLLGLNQYNHTMNFLGLSNCSVKLSQRFAKRLLSIDTVCCMASDNEFFLVTPRNTEAHIKMAEVHPSVCRYEASQELLIWHHKNWQWWVLTPFFRPFIIWFRSDGFYDYLTLRPTCICVHSSMSTDRCVGIYLIKIRFITFRCNPYVKM